jgi:hypothetical protein
MLPWFPLFANTLWVLALALLLATLSYGAYVASLRHARLGSVLALPPYQASLNLAGLLFCLGLALTSTAIWWQVALWAVLALLFATRLVRRKT